jgi:hypothetical protein
MHEDQLLSLFSFSQTVAKLIAVVKYSLFFDVTQRKLAVSYRGFGTTNRFWD